MKAKHTFIALGMLLGFAASSTAMASLPNKQQPLKPRIVVLTDVSTWETDDSESLVRLFSYADLFEIVGAGDGFGSFPRSIQGGQQHRREDCNDCYNDQQLNKSKDIEVPISAIRLLLDIHSHCLSFQVRSVLCYNYTTNEIDCLYFFLPCQCGFLPKIEKA